MGSMFSRFHTCGKGTKSEDRREIVCCLHLYCRVRGGREHEDSMWRFSESQDCHNAYVTIECTVVVEGGTLIHLDVLTVGSWREKNSGTPLIRTPELIH